MRKTRRVLLHTLAAAFAIVVLATAAAAWRLSSGPLSLAFLEDEINAALDERFFPYVVRFDDLVLTWAGWQRVFDLRALDVVIGDGGGKAVARVPELALGLSGPDLLKGRIEPVSIELLGPSITLARESGGEFVVGLGPDSAPASGAATPFEQLLAGLDAGPDDGSGARLEQLSVLDADLTIDDRLNELVWQAHGIDVDLFRTETGIAGNLNLSVPFDEITTVLGGDIVYDRTDAQFRLLLHLENALPHRLAAISPDLAPLEALQTAISGDIEAVFDSRFALATVDFDLAASAGHLSLPDELPEPLGFSYAYLKGTSFDRFEALRLDELYVDFDGTTLALSGLFATAPQAPAAQGSVAIENLAFDDADRFWPRSFAPYARAWIVPNLTEGVVRSLDADFDLDADDFNSPRIAEDAVDGRMVLENLTVNYLDTLPKARAIEATVLFDSANFWIDIASGALLETIRVEKSALVLSDVGGANALSLDVRLRGPSREILAVLDEPRLGYPGRYGMAPAAVGGEADVRMLFSFPMLADLALQDVTLGATATFTDFSWPDAIEGYDVAGGRFAMTLEDTGIDITGPATINGVPVDLAWRENFADDAPFLSQLTVRASLDDAAFAAWAVPAAPYLAGRFDTEIAYIDYDRRRQQILVDLDALDGRIAPPGLEWEKPPGAAGVLSFTLGFGGGDEAVAIESLTLSAEGFLAQGTGVLEPGFGGLRALDLTTLRFGETDAQMRWRPLAANPAGHDIVITAESFDLVPYLDSLTEESDEPMPDMALALDARRLVTREGGPDLSDALLRLRFENDSLRRLDLDGTLEGGQPMQLRLAPNEAGTERTVRMVSDDAGALLKTLDLVDTMKGGSFVLDATLDDTKINHPMTGTIKIADYRIVKAPTLAVLLNYASLFGLIDLLQGEGIGFSRLEMPFRVENDILSTSDARTWGTSLGLNAEGTVDLASDEMNLAGTIVPAYAVNSLLGNIPIVGDILVGGKGEGIIASNFSVKGPFGDPSVSVNPASMLTPGFLRHLFGVFDGGSGVAPPSDIKQPGAPGNGAESPEEAAPGEPADEAP